MINLTMSCDTSASCTTLSPIQNGVTASDTARTHNHAEINDLLMTYSRSKETNVLNEVTIHLYEVHHGCCVWYSLSYAYV